MRFQRWKGGITTSSAVQLKDNTRT